MPVVESTPNIYGGLQTNYPYVSSYALRALINNEELYNQLVRRFGGQGSGLQEFLDMCNDGMRAVSGLNFQHDEEDRIQSILKVGNLGAGAAGASVTLVVAAAYRPNVPTSAQSPYLVTGATTGVAPVRVNDVISVPATTGNVFCRVNSFDRSNGNMVVTPLVSTEAVPAVTTNTEIPVLFNSWPEGSAQPDAMASRKISYINNIYIHKGTASVTGTALGTKTWFTNLGESGSSSLLFDENIFAEKRRAQNQLEYALLTSKKTTNTTNADTTITTEGIIPFIENNGNVDTYTTFGFTDLDTMIDLLVANKGADEYAMFLSPKFKRAIDNLLRNEVGMTAGGIVYNYLGGEEKYVSFGFGSFTYGGLSLHLKTLGAFQDPVALGAAGQPYVDMGILIPMDKTNVIFGGSNSKVSVPSMQGVYQDVAGEDKGYKEWTIGSAGAVSTNDIDTQQVNMRWRRGIECYAGNRFGLFKK